MESDVGNTSSAAAAGGEAKYKGVRRRQWGKWVSEIRVPGSRERLWLGSYSNPEAAAVAHDTAVFFLRGPAGPTEAYNFPDRVGQFAWAGLSPRSVQKVASDHGMAVDAELAIGRSDSVADIGKQQQEGASQQAMSGWGWGNGCEIITVDGMDFYV